MTEIEKKIARVSLRQQAHRITRQIIIDQAIDRMISPCNRCVRDCKTDGMIFCIKSERKEFSNVT